MSRPMRAASIMLSGTAALCAGCAARAPAPDAAARPVPADFSFGFVVPEGVEALDDASPSPAQAQANAPCRPRASVGMLEADGTLRWEAGPMAALTPRPGVRGVVASRQRCALWERLEAAGLLRVDGPGQQVGDAWEAARDGRAVGVWWSAQGRRRSMLMAPAADDGASDGPGGGRGAWESLACAIVLVEEWATGRHEAGQAPGASVPSLP